MEEGKTTSSDFIYINKVSDIEMLDDCGSTSLAYKIRIDGRTYFMKQLRPEFQNETRYRDAFFKEFHTGRSIQSPHVVKYLDIKEDMHGLYILMEYVNGPTLKEKIAKEPEYFSRKENIHSILLQLCNALKALHKENVVHLDLAPSNIIIQQTSNSIKLIDLGFCQSNYDDSSPGCTAGFTAPEAVNGDIKEIDARTDIYAIGCILQFIEKESGVKLPSYAKKIKKRCLQPQKDKRYCNVDEIIAQLQNEPKKKIVSATIAVIAATLLALCGISLYQSIEEYLAWENGKIPSKFEEGGIAYQIIDHKARTVEVTYKGEAHEDHQYEYEGEVTIPAEVTHRGREFRVVSIARNAFNNPETLNVILPEGLETIKEEAFAICRITATIRIPKSVKEIGVWNYQGKNFIEGFIVDSGNPIYDSRGGCNAIIETATNTIIATCKNSVIPHDVTTIGQYAICDYQGEHFTIPANITTLGYGAFYSSEFTELEIPNSITEIGGMCFFDCKQMQWVKISENISRIEEYTFANCGLQEVLIPEKVSYIGQKSFANCKSLQTVTIGSGVRGIGAYAFEDCENLTRVISRIPADSLNPTGSGSFLNVNKKCVLYVPRGAKNKYKNTNGWGNFSKIIEMDM